MTWGQRGRCGDDGDMWRPHGDLLLAMGMTGMMGMMWGDHGDDVGMTGMTWGRRGPRGDNKITKNAITFEQIEIIELRLKIWDP